jgi:3-oxoacyl-[acyl-carrier protein] reductase
MHIDLTNKKVLVTGSSHGIGFEIARAFHAEGSKVVLNARNLENLQKASKKLEGSFIADGDVSNTEIAKKVISKAIAYLGEIDILVCNVGNSQSVQAGEENALEWEQQFKYNFLSATNVIEAARNSLSVTKGNIICISSICGLEYIPGAPLTYSTFKAALNTYIHGIARPLGNQGIRINAIAPGNIFFDGSIWEKKVFEKKQAVEKMLKSEVSLGCFGRLEDISNLVIFLASDLAEFATGSIWTIDGGQVRS